MENQQEKKDSTDMSEEEEEKKPQIHMPVYQNVPVPFVPKLPDSRDQASMNNIL